MFVFIWEYLEGLLRACCGLSEVQVAKLKPLLKYLITLALNHKRVYKCSSIVK